MEKYNLGSLEFAFKIINRKTGEETIVVSTPSMWARMTEERDKMIKKAEHSEQYILERYVQGLVLLAAGEAGLCPKPKGIPSLYEEAAFVNDFDAIDVTSEYKEAPEGNADPFDTAQEGDQAAL